MILYFLVEKVAHTRHRLFSPDPNDPLNTVDSGKYLQELHLEVIPDELRGGKGLMVVQLMEAEQIGTFKPGDKVRVEMSVVEG
jgi:hypothetical protein